VRSSIPHADKCRQVVIITATVFLLIALTACGTSTSNMQPAARSLAAKPGSSVPILLFVGTGTSASDVSAVETILNSNKLSYATANSSQIEGMSESALKAYKLLIVPGGNSISIGQGLSSTATNNIHNAVQSGLNYLGICAGGYFGGYSEYNGLNLTSGVWFDTYSNNGRGTGKTAIEISNPSTGNMDQYWQDGPQFTGWGTVVGKYPDGLPAIVEGNSGSGWVILSGIHAEAPTSWRYGMSFSTPVQTDNAYAYTMIEAALNGKSLAY